MALSTIQSSAWCDGQRVLAPRRVRSGALEARLSRGAKVMDESTVEPVVGLDPLAAGSGVKR